MTNIYNINTAGMVNVNPETVNVMNSQIQAIASQEPELAQRLARLTEALEAPEFSADQRKQLEENIQDLATEVKQPQDQKAAESYQGIRGRNRRACSTSAEVP